MDDLKILIDTLANMPSLAIWVVAMYFFFKIAVVGSIFGIIRVAIMKLHDWAKTKKESKLVTIETTRDVIEVKQLNFGKKCITDVISKEYDLLQDIHNWLSANNNNGAYTYILDSDIRIVKEFWDKFKAEQVIKNAK